VEGNDMSILIHRCRRCGHPDIFSGVQPGYWREVRYDNRAADCSHRWCKTCVGIGCDYGPEPEVIPTWNTRTGAPEPLYEPGSVLNGSAGSALPICGCDECRATYAALTVGATA
jgi:hypothetical protein